jgi:hypothetical protein
LARDFLPDIFPLDQEFSIPAQLRVYAVPKDRKDTEVHIYAA